MLNCYILLLYDYKRASRTRVKRLANTPQSRPACPWDIKETVDYFLIIYNKIYLR